MPRLAPGCRPSPVSAWSALPGSRRCGCGGFFLLVAGAPAEPERFRMPADVPGHGAEAESEPHKGHDDGDPRRALRQRIHTVVDDDAADHRRETRDYAVQEDAEPAAFPRHVRGEA